MNKRLVLRAGAISALALLAAPGFAQDPFPSRPIKMIVPAAAGGSTDIGARLISKLMGQALGEPVVVDNRGGAGGRIGPAEVARAQGGG